MADLLSNDTDLEMEKYFEAETLSFAGLDPAIIKNKQSIFNPETKTNEILTPMDKGGYFKIGEEPVEVMSEAPMQPAMPGNNIDQIPLDLAAQEVAEYAKRLENDVGKFDVADLEAAGYTGEQIEAGMNLMKPAQETPTVEPMTSEELATAIANGEPMIGPYDPTLREEGVLAVENFVVDLAVAGLRDELLEANPNMTEEQIQQEIDARMPEFKNNAGFYSNMFFGTGNPLGVGIGDFATAGIMDMQEGARMFSQGRDRGQGGDISKRAIGAALMLAGAAEATGVGFAFGKLLKRGINILSPSIVRMGADAEQRIAQEGSTVFSNPVGPMVDRGLAAAGRLMQPNIKIGPPSDTPMVSQLQPQYRVTVENAPIIGTGKQSFIPKKMTPGNFQVSSQSLTTLSEEFADPLSSPENYALMMSRVQNASEVPAPPSWMIEHANDTDKWANWFKGLTENQVKAANEGLSIQEDFKQAYSAGADPELTGQLMLWSILSRRLSAFPHEGGYLELAEAASPFIQKAARGEWSEADTEAWLQMVKTTIPEGTPGRSATSNANDFGKVFLKKMAAVDESGVSALTRLHQMIADPNMSSAQIRRAYYGLAEDTGIANKILSFALLVSGRNDVVVLDRIQINRMWAGGDKIYDDVYTQFEGAQGLAQYEALERSLNTRVKDMYTKAGRGDVGSVGRYHWESWVLSSGQVVSHPTLSSVVGSGLKTKQSNIKPTELTPVKEGRFHVKYSGVEYEKTPGGGNRYVYRTSQGEPYQFTKKQLDDMFKEVFSKKSGVLPSNFPGVASFEGGNKPWYEFEGVDRGAFDAIIRQSGKSVAE
jgi:hypothetical protein